MSESHANHHFVGLILSLHSSAWIHLGKVANPATGKTERNLEAAREVIDLLGALEEKTRGNRVDDEDRMMTQILTELRMNYVDELERSKSESTDAGAQPSADAPAASATASDTGANAQTHSESGDDGEASSETGDDGSSGTSADADESPDAASTVAAEADSAEEKKPKKSD